jgi:hypothetical protein
MLHRAERLSHLTAFVESLGEALGLRDDDVGLLKSMVESAATQGGLVSMPDRGEDYVVVRRLGDLIGELLCDVKLNAPANPAWLALTLKVLITCQVSCAAVDSAVVPVNASTNGLVFDTGGEQPLRRPCARQLQTAGPRFGASCLAGGGGH